MGSFSSRQQAAVEEAEQGSSHAYKYPPRSGNFFGSHFIMGGERFDTPQPESYLFGENADLNFLGNRPTAFPYPPPQANEPTKTLKSLVNIRKESVRFVRTVNHEKKADPIISSVLSDSPDGNVLCLAGAGDGVGAQWSYNIEFTFDSDAKCAITIYYFCTEEVSPSGVTLIPREGLTSETFHYDKGINQYFSQPSHVFNPQLIPEDDLIYNPSKEQYPVAIHCVVEEGNEECRQSHTTICVIDHHPETGSYQLRALKQKIFVDGLCYLLQEIYGIENKAVNKSSIDEDLDDHGSECVICMSETRDTLILPCRHLCLCNSCADSLRYQANNCPICRAPFRALLQIRAVQKGVAPHMIHQSAQASGGGSGAGSGGGGTGDAASCDQHLPPGYIPVSLIEALNGPPQYVARSSRLSDADATDGVGGTNAPTAMDSHKASPPQKPSGQRRSKTKKSAVAAATNSTVGGNDTVGITNSTALSMVEIGLETSGKKPLSTRPLSQEKLQIVNERHSLKLPKAKRSSNCGVGLNAGAATACSAHNVGEAEDDSDNEKLSPLLSPGSRCKSMPSPELNSDSVSGAVDSDNGEEDEEDDEDNVHNVEDNDGNGVVEESIARAEVDEKSVPSTLTRRKRSEIGPSADGPASVDRISGISDAVAITTAEDSDYYTPEDTQNSILSPLCPERGKIIDKLGGLKTNAGSFKGASGGVVKKSLHKKSTSVGNISGPGVGGVCGVAVVGGDLKGNVSSLPDMLDSPIAGHSTRSSSDSYSSSSSTKQLLSSNTPSAAAANIIVDDKTSLQNAVNV